MEQAEKMILKFDDVKEIFETLENSKKICIVGHKSPDGDCIGSVMALYEFLKGSDKNITVCLDGKIPYNYIEFVGENEIAREYDNASFDVVVIMDCGDAKRLGKFENVITNTKKTICIDHHKTNLNFADINIIDPNSSSTGELFYHILETANKQITLKMAEYMYVAIVTDTGKFSYSATQESTHIVAAKLIGKGVDVARIDNILYNSKPANVVKAYIDCISNIKLYCDNKIGVALITQKILKDNHVEMPDVDGVVEFIREIKDVEISCVLKETNDVSTKVSLRSKTDIDVSAISVKYKGGGHAKAAGFDINDNIENALKIIINELKSVIGV